MIERRDVVSQTTELVVRETTSEGRPAAEYDRRSAWLHLTTRPVRPEDEWLGRLAELPSIHESTRRFSEIADKYDRIARCVEYDAVDDVTETELLAALLVIRELREKLQTDEARLLGAARRKKVTWARLAAALGLKSRQAAERRHLQLRSDLDEVNGKRLKQAERVVYARAVRDRHAEQAWAEWHTVRVTELAQSLAALADLRARVAAPWADRLAEALAGLAALDSAGPVQSASDLDPERYAATWRTEFTLRLFDLLAQVGDSDLIDLGGHPRLLSDIKEFCAAAGTVARP